MTPIDSYGEMEHCLHTAGVASSNLASPTIAAITDHSTRDSERSQRDPRIMRTFRDFHSQDFAEQLFKSQLPQSRNLQWILQITEIHPTYRRAISRKAALSALFRHKPRRTM
mgnify:CR=1 FL=1